MQFVEQIIDSREVAEMVGKEHKELLRDIRRYCGQLGESKIALTDFFTESTYVTEQNKTMPCFMVTKKGCEFIAHKLTGQKGTEFTARYINRFHEMEEQLMKENHMDWFVNDIRVFQHREFGILRTLKLDGQDYFVGIDVTRSLGYVNNTDTLRKRVSESEKCYVGICDGNQCRKMVAITVRGLNELVQTGRLPLNMKYGDWIQKQVLPALGNGKSISDEANNGRDMQGMAHSIETAAEDHDMVRHFRELVSELPLDALDAMEKGFRDDKNPAMRWATASILAEKMKRQLA
ncbi:MAG: hypothetical protein HFH92_05880 [Lachnospiraceae bacterium]|jgi:Rha family phage regulatory protein|nr:hypothetical protein [Lachnospiraceae bacterium]